MLHIARKTSKGKIKHISLTSYEAFTLLSFLTEVINQLDTVKDLGQPGQKLIPFFKDENRAFEHENCNWESFWATPDLQLPSVRVRLGLNRKTGMYVLLMNSPVSTKLSLDYHNWQGPQLQLKHSSIKTLKEFIEIVLSCK